MSIPLSQPPSYVGPVTSASGSTISFSASSPAWTGSQWTYQWTYANSGNVSGTTYYALIGPNPVALQGTVTTSSNSNVITGVGTLFQTGTTPVNAGDTLIVNGYSVFTVTGVSSDTSLTVSAPANTGTNATISGLSASVSSASTNPNEGRIYTILASDSNSITLNLNGDTIASVGAGTQIQIIPYWTLGTLFPATAAGTAFTSSTSTKLAYLQTQVLIPDYTAAGINLAAPYFYYFSSANNRWQQYGVTGNANDVILQPNGYVIVRNPASTPASTVTIQGNVPMTRTAVVLNNLTTGPQDNFAGIARPVDVTLNNLGLISSGVFQSSTSSKLAYIQDELLVFDNTTPVIFKAAGKFYYYMNGVWRLYGDSADHGSDVIPAGTGFLIRKAKSNTGVTQFWQHTPTYN